MACTLHPDDIKSVKGQGFLLNKGTNCFNARIVAPCGKITAEQAAVLSKAAELYGSGEICFTSRLDIEIPGIPFEKIPEFQEYIGKAGLYTGGTGPKVRPIVSCKGTTCHFGLHDTFDLAQKMHDRFYLGYHHITLPHKFKIAVGGCPNNCVKPDTNDLAVIGQRVPQVDLEKCKGCKVCQIEVNCPMKAAHVKDGKIAIDPAVCNRCGRCIGKCPFHVFDEGKDAYLVRIGGRWGKTVERGMPLTQLIVGQENVLNLVEKAILLFKEQGVAGERFNDTIKRLGFENVEKMLLGDELLQRKDQILGK